MNYWGVCLEQNHLCDSASENFSATSLFIKKEVHGGIWIYFNRVLNTYKITARLRNSLLDMVVVMGCEYNLPMKQKAKKFHMELREKACH